MEAGTAPGEVSGTAPGEVSHHPSMVWELWRTKQWPAKRVERARRNGCQQPHRTRHDNDRFRCGTAWSASERSVCKHRGRVVRSYHGQLNQQDLAGSGHIRAYEQRVRLVFGGLHRPRPDNRSGGALIGGAQRHGSEAAGL